MPSRFRSLALALSLSISAGCPSLAATSETVIDARNGNAFHGIGSDIPVDAGSAVRLMTIYVALDALDRNELDPTDATSVPDASLGSDVVVSGKEYPFQSLIHALALSPSRNASIAIAVAVSGNVQSFVARMNAVSAAMGLDRTSYADPHGLSPGNITSSDDLAELFRRVSLGFPAYSYLFRQDTMRVGGEPVRKSAPGSLRYHPGFAGSLSSVLSDGSINEVSMIRDRNKSVVMVILGSRSKNGHAARMGELAKLGLSLAIPGLPDIPPLRPNVGPGDYPIPDPSLDEKETEYGSLANFRSVSLSRPKPNNKTNDRVSGPPSGTTTPVQIPITVSKSLAPKTSPSDPATIPLPKPAPRPKETSGSTGANGFLPYARMEEKTTAPSPAINPYPTKFRGTSNGKPFGIKFPGFHSAGE